MGILGSMDVLRDYERVGCLESAFVERLSQWMEMKAKLVEYGDWRVDQICNHGGR
jgi:hypothetical protein